jgi:organic radical activating enzyme
MAKRFIDCIAIYITNVCGMTCEGCVTFNNYILKGHYDWKSYKEKIVKWGELLEVRQITIIGGEPFLHPNLDEWVIGIRNAFLNCKDIRVVTGLTGSLLEKYKTNILHYIDNDVSIQISVHDPNWWELSKETARNILQGREYQEIQTIDRGSFPLKTIDFKNSNNNLIFSMMELWSFFPNAQKEIRDGVIYMHDNDPVLAHNSCYCRSSQYIFEGNLYKCALTSVSSVLVSQLPLDDRSKKLLNEATGIDPFDENINLDFSTPIPQCSLCSINMEKLIPIYPLSVKKLKL